MPFAILGLFYVLLLLPEKALELNDTAVKLVERASGERTLGELISELAAQHWVPRVSRTRGGGSPSSPTASRG